MLLFTLGRKPSKDKRGKLKFIILKSVHAKEAYVMTWIIYAF